MTSLKRFTSSIAAVCALCSALAIGASADMISTDAVASTTGAAISFNYYEVYQPYRAFFTTQTYRSLSSAHFKTTITRKDGPLYTLSSAVYAPNSSADPYSYVISMKGTGTFTGNYKYYSTSSTESKPVVMGIGFDSRETSGTIFSIVGNFVANAN